MSRLSGDVLVAGQDLYVSSSTQLHPLGSRIDTQDGRSFRYVKAGGTSLVAGQLQACAAQVTNHQNLTPSAAAIGATSIDVTLGATATTLNQYADGMAIITVTPGVGYSYSIKSNPVIAASALGTIQLNDPIQVALTATSRVDLVANPYLDVIVAPTTYTGHAVGVATDIITNAQFGWIQTHGTVGCLADGALVVGEPVIRSNGVAGAVEPTTTTFTVQGSVGYAQTGVATTEYGAIFLTLD